MRKRSIPERRRARIEGRGTRPDADVNVTRGSRSKYTPAGRRRNVPRGNR